MWREHVPDTPSHPSIPSSILSDSPCALHTAPLVSKRGYPGEFSVKASQLKDCEMLERAGMGMANHLDWFISTKGSSTRLC